MPSLITHCAGTGHARETPARGRTPLTPARHLRQPSDPPGGDAENASSTAYRPVRTLEVIYRALARPWPVDELAARYQAAYERGASDMPADEAPPDRPITLLATAIPRLISLAVAANVLHVLPAAALDAAIGNDILGTLDLTAAGSLHRCHLALEADARARSYDADEWLPLAYEQGRRLARTRLSRGRSAGADRPRPAGRPLRRARDRLAGPRRAERARGDHRHPRPPPHRLRVRRHRPHDP